MSAQRRSGALEVELRQPAPSSHVTRSRFPCGWLPTRNEQLKSRNNFLPSTPKPANFWAHIFTHSIMLIHIYAEHLINIRTLTIQISLPTSSDASTTLFTDGNTFALSHQGETAQVTLPVSVPDSERAKLSLSPVPNTNLSFRIRLDDTSPRDSQSGETVIPWTATSLSQQVELQCKTCHAEILPRGQIQTWKDLPSEGWAEMMEFWHCHKPNEPHDHEHQTDKKGYSADSMLAITPSIGLVNATSFVLAADDCKNITVGRIPSSHFSFSSENLTDNVGNYKEPALPSRKATINGRFEIKLP